VTRLERRILVISAILIGASFGLVAIFYSLMLASGDINARLNVLKSLVEANTALLGFLGVITVFVLTSYRDSIGRMERDIDHLRENHARNVKQDMSVGYPNISSTGLSRMADAEYERFLTREKKLNSGLEDLKKGISSTCFYAIATATAFVFSILFCLLGISEISLLITHISTYTAAVITICGVWFTFIMVLDLRQILV